jgi:hypothetical protein
MFRRSETARTVGLVIAGLSVAVLVAAASPARPPATNPTAPSVDAAPCEAVAARARGLGDARWSAEGTGAVEALVDIVPEAPASAVPEAQVAGDPAVREALGLGSRDTPVEVRRLPGSEVYEVSHVAGSAACQSLVFARRTPGKPVAILPSPALQGEMCSGGYAHVGRAGGQPALIQIQRAAASPGEAAASRKPLVEIRVTPWTGAGWGRTCKVGLAFRAERKLADRLCARPADCKAFEPTAGSLASAFNRTKAQDALNRRAPTPVRYFPEGPPKGSEAAVAQVKAYMAKAQRPLPLFGTTPKTPVMPGYSEDELDFVPVRIDGRAFVATVGFPGIGWRQDRSATLVTLFEAGKAVTPRATYIFTDGVSGLESAKVELARD